MFQRLLPFRFRFNCLVPVPLQLPPATLHAQLTGSRFRAPQISRVHQLCNLQLRRQRVSTKSAAMFSRRVPVQPQHLFTVSVSLISQAGGGVGPHFLVRTFFIWHVNDYRPFVRGRIKTARKRFEAMLLFVYRTCFYVIRLWSKRDFGKMM
jgi:hypothetical protein